MTNSPELGRRVWQASAAPGFESRAGFPTQFRTIEPPDVPVAISESP